MRKKIKISAPFWPIFNFELGSDTSLLVMADMEKFYDDLIIINLYDAYKYPMQRSLLLFLVSFHVKLVTNRHAKVKTNIN